MNLKDIFSRYADYKQKGLSGRYNDLDLYYSIMSKFSNEFTSQQIGKSVNKLPIYVVKWGNGPRKVLAWSLMHGNETTTTKSLFDLVNYLNQEKDSEDVILLNNKIQLAMIFVLNPDGTKAFTRVNANEVDLNRDAQKVSQPEMLALHEYYAEFKPDLCLNLHEQRSIFSAGATPNPAIISFLAPAVNKIRSITSARKESMQLISSMYTFLEDYIPNKIGTYDDAYNPNCTGDYFQGLGTTCILFEAGHYPEDYHRDGTRKLIFMAYLRLLNVYMLNQLPQDGVATYQQIPKNQKLFADFILRKVKFKNKAYDLIVQYEENLVHHEINFVPKLIDIQENTSLYAHQEILIEDELTMINEKEVQHMPELNTIINNIRTKTKFFSLKMVKNLN